MPRLLIPIFLLFAFAAELTAQIVAFGASNVAGAGVQPQQAWPAQLEKLLKAQGYDVHIINAGISGDTTADMLNRLDNAIPNGTKIVILDTGGGFFNDAKKQYQPGTRRKKLRHHQSPDPGPRNQDRTRIFLSHVRKMETTRPDPPNH
jgi:lysophospholipase L1-like esterase